MKNKLISIVGPTATGKTGLALAFAEQVVSEGKYQGLDLISVDSRQVYQGLEVVSGADVPAGFQQRSVQGYEYPLFENNKIRLHGVGILKPTDEWSVGQFQTWALPLIKQVWDEKRLPTLIGGTGLYHQHLFNPDPKLRIKPSSEVRSKAEQMSVEELHGWLNKVDSKKLATMNHSDRNNPRRLIRAIEVATQLPEVKQKQVTKSEFEDVQQIKTGLIDSLENIETRIKQRVLDRFANGAVKEIRKLIEDYPSQTGPAFSSLGVPEIKSWLSGEVDDNICLQDWTLHEFQYAKRQLTWWKKYGSEIKWFTVSQLDWRSQAIAWLKKELY